MQKKGLVTKQNSIIEKTLEITLEMIKRESRLYSDNLFFDYPELKSDIEFIKLRNESKYFLFLIYSVWRHRLIINKDVILNLTNFNDLIESNREFYKDKVVRVDETREDVIIRYASDFSFVNELYSKVLNSPFLLDAYFSLGMPVIDEEVLKAMVAIEFMIISTTKKTWS